MEDSHMIKEIVAKHSKYIISCRFITFYEFEYFGRHFMLRITTLIDQT